MAAVNLRVGGELSCSLMTIDTARRAELSTVRRQPDDILMCRHCQVSRIQTVTYLTDFIFKLRIYLDHLRHRIL